MNTGIIFSPLFENVLSFNLTPWFRKSGEGKRRNSSFKLTVFCGCSKAYSWHATHHVVDRQLTFSVFIIMNFSAFPDPIFWIKVSNWSSEHSQYNDVKLFLYSSYFLLEIVAKKRCTFSFPWPLDLKWTASDSNDSAFCSWENKLSNKPGLVMLAVWIETEFRGPKLLNHTIT